MQCVSRAQGRLRTHAYGRTRLRTHKHAYGRMPTDLLVCSYAEPRESNGRARRAAASLPPFEGRARARRQGPSYQGRPFRSWRSPCRANRLIVGVRSVLRTAPHDNHNLTIRHNLTQSDTIRHNLTQSDNHHSAARGAVLKYHTPHRATQTPVTAHDSSTPPTHHPPPTCHAGCVETTARVTMMSCDDGTRSFQPLPPLHPPIGMSKYRNVGMYTPPHTMTMWRHARTHAFDRMFGTDSIWRLIRSNV